MRIGFLTALAIAAAAPAAAQIKTPASGPASMVDLERRAASPQPDVTAVPIELTNSGYVRYRVSNLSGGAAGPFVVDVLINGKRVDTMKHNGLGANSSQVVTSTLARAEGCASAMVTLVSDAQQVVTEYDETNNSREKAFTPACPDFDVGIKRDWVDMNTRFRVVISVTNTGTAPSPKVLFKITEGETDAPQNVVGCLAGANIDAEIPALQPGEKHSFHLPGRCIGTKEVWVKVMVDYYRTVAEINEDNNVFEKTP